MDPKNIIDMLVKKTIIIAFILLAYLKLCAYKLLSGATPLTGIRVLDGTGQIILDGLSCTGSESRLVNCPHNGFLRHDCSHSEDAGVICLPSSSKIIVYQVHLL